MGPLGGGYKKKRGGEGKGLGTKIRGERKHERKGSDNIWGRSSSLVTKGDFSAVSYPSWIDTFRASKRYIYCCHKALILGQFTFEIYTQENI